MTTIIDYLELLGLSKKEKEIFLTLLKMGEMTAYQAHKHVSIQRTTVYPLLEKLIQKNLILEKVVGSKKLYAIVDAKSLEDLIETRVSGLKKLKKELPVFMKQFKSSTNAKETQKTTIYEGEKGVLALANEVANFKGEVYCLGSLGGVNDILGEKYYDNFYNKARRKNLGTDYLISDWTKMTVKYFFKESGMFTKRRFIPANIKVDGGFMAFGDKLVIGRYNPEITAVVIQDRGLVEIFKLAYFSLWKDLENKNIPQVPAGGMPEY